MEQDNQGLDVTPVEGERPVPVGWRILFWGLVAFGAWYLWAYTPAFTGWTQARDLEAGGGSGLNILATIVFTALAVVAAAAIVVAMSHRKPAGSPPAGSSTGPGEPGA
jgi:hypothetical protein